jgi:N-ethylmaleimide reductase
MSPIMNYVTRVFPIAFFMQRGEKQKMSHISSIILRPFRLTSSLTLQNRLVMAPMTRCFAPNHEPTEAMAAYYGKRGDFGLVISEATMVDRDATGYPDTPGIFSGSQIIQWKKVSDKVHEKGGRFFLQLWHAGMMSHPVYRRGKQPISASDVIPKKGVIPRIKWSFEI